MLHTPVPTALVNTCTPTHPHWNHHLHTQTYLQSLLPLSPNPLNILLLSRAAGSGTSDPPGTPRHPWLPCTSPFPSPTLYKPTSCPFSHYPHPIKYLTFIQDSWIRYIGPPRDTETPLAALYLPLPSPLPTPIPTSTYDNQVLTI